MSEIVKVELLIESLIKILVVALIGILVNILVELLLFDWRSWCSESEEFIPLLDLRVHSLRLEVVISSSSQQHCVRLECFSFVIILLNIKLAKPRQLIRSTSLELGLPEATEASWLLQASFLFGLLLIDLYLDLSFLFAEHAQRHFVILSDDELVESYLPEAELGDV